jgi:hypothetical protein
MFVSFVITALVDVCLWQYFVLTGWIFSDYFGII